MEPANPAKSNEFQSAMDYLKNRMGPNGSISMFLIPRTPTKTRGTNKIKKTQDQNVIANKNTGSVLENSLNNGIHICGEVITIQETSSTSTSVNSTNGDKCAQLSENEEKLNEDDTNYSTNTTLERSSPEAIAVSATNSKENAADAVDMLHVFSPTIKHIKAGDHTFYISSATSVMSVENNDVSNLTKDKTSAEKYSNCLNDCPKQILSSHSPLKQHNAKSDHQNPQHEVEFSCHVSPMKNVINKTTHSSGSPMSLGEQIRYRSKSANKPLGSSKDHVNSVPSRSVSYNLRQSRQQPLRFAHIAPTNCKQAKVVKTQKRKTIGITFPLLSSDAENNLLNIFCAMANFHGCEITIDGRSLNVPFVKVPRSQVYHSRKQEPSQHSKENLPSNSQRTLSQNVSYINKNDDSLLSLYPEVVLCTPQHQS